MGGIVALLGDLLGEIPGNRRRDAVGIPGAGDGDRQTSSNRGGHRLDRILRIQKSVHTNTGSDPPPAELFSLDEMN